VSEPNIRRITSIGEWDELAAMAGKRPVWLFKHSLICPLSASGRKEFERFVAAAAESDTLFAMVEVQNARDTSDELARRFGVRHETPQAILLIGDNVRWHGSHWDISASTLARADGETASAAGAGCE
jgi:bacillithiol system protein YtxJ